MALAPWFPHNSIALGHCQAVFHARTKEKSCEKLNWVSVGSLQKNDFGEDSNHSQIKASINASKDY